MFHHAVLFRLREGVTLDRVRRARKALAELAETLPGCLHFAVCDNLSGENRGYTLALFATFESRKAYEIYSRHPEVQRVQAEFAPVVTERIVAEGEGSPE
ncbi:MAG: Dabb family protein [Planctomycetes bacterium]|nr:Dabb family protein [Planctomycetota bacterium]